MLMRGNSLIQDVGIASMARRGSKIIINHVQNVDSTALLCKELRKDRCNGYDAKKTYRIIAEIPALTFYAHPELHERPGKVNRKEMYKFLRSPQGEMFRTVEKL